MPPGRKQINTKWVFKVKENEVGKIEIFKARWAVKGYLQNYGIDYDLTHAPVSRLSTMITIPSLAVKLKLKIHHMDISTGFLNAVLNDLVYVIPPPGYEHILPKNKSFLLIKALYGLKQASPMVNKLLDLFLNENCGMVPIDADCCLYTSHKDGNRDMVMIVYVDGILLLSKSDKTLELAKKVMGARFKMNNLEIIRCFRGILVEHAKNVSLSCVSERIKLAYPPEVDATITV